MTDEWEDEALCAQTDPEIFFPEPGRSNRAAKKVCNDCPVVAQCLFKNLDEPWGIYGGLSPVERRRLKAGVE